MTPSNANTSGLAQDLCERLDAILIEESPMHPFGCATWEEATGVAIDMAKEVIVTAASAQARISELEAGVAALIRRRDDLLDTTNRYQARYRAAEARADRRAKALERIERWFGEFPETGRNWPNDDGSDSDRPMPYGACWGSNGERDYMRSVARASLQQEG